LDGFNTILFISWIVAYFIGPSCSSVHTDYMTANLLSCSPCVLNYTMVQDDVTILATVSWSHHRS